MKQKIIAKIVLVILGIFTAFIFSIIADRLVGVYLNRIGYFKAMQPSITEIYDTKEFNIVAKISSQGIRDDTVVTPKPKDVYRILTVGDSFTFGWGVSIEDSWVKILEENLKIPDKKIEVINAGAPGAGPTEQRWICQAYSDYLEVDLLIAAFYGRDDLYQVAIREQNLTGFQNFLERTWPTLERISSSVIIRSWHEDDKRGGTYVSSKYWKEESKAALRIVPSILKQLSPEIVDDYKNGKINPSRITTAYQDREYLIKMLDEKNFRYALGAFAKRMKRLKDECAYDKSVIVLLLPGSSVVSMENFKYRRAEGFLVDDRLLDLDLDTPISKLARENGFTYLSLFKNFREDGCPDCHYKLDSHLTPKGNKRVAEYLVREFTKILPQIVKDSR